MNTRDEELFKAIIAVIESRQQAEQIIKRYYRDKMVIVWKTKDVHRAANERGIALTEKEAVEVLQILHQQHNPQLGLRWNDLWEHLDLYQPGRKLTKAELKRFVKLDIIAVAK